MIRFGSVISVLLSFLFVTTAQIPTCCFSATLPSENRHWIIADLFPCFAPTPFHNGGSLILAITMVWLIPLVTDFHCFPQKWEEEDNLRLSPLPIPWEPFLWKSWQHCRVVKILYGLNQTLAKITQPISYCNRNAAVRCDARPWAVLSVVAGHLSNCFIISLLVNSFGLRFSECTL